MRLFSLLIALTATSLIVIACDEPEATDQADESQAADQADEPAPEQQETAEPPPDIDDEDRHVYEDKYSYVPPEGWSEQEVPPPVPPEVVGPSMAGPTVGGMTSNMVVTEEPGSHSYDTVVGASVREIENELPDYDVGDPRTSTTYEGNEITIIDAHPSDDSQPLKMRSMVLDTDPLYVVTCAGSPDDEGVLDLCKESTKTFRAE